MLEVIEFLKNNSLEELKQQFAIKARRHQRYPHIVSLKYSQLDSPKRHPIVRECRGLVLDTRTYSILAYPYKRFFNHGEEGADAIDWSTARCYDKADGSLLVLYHAEGEWWAATSGTPDACGEVGTFPFTFQDLFWRTWYELGYRLPTDTQLCYMFELMTPFNRVLVRHHSNQLVLHGARDLVTLEEFHPEVISELYGWECIESYPLGNWEDALAAAAALDPMESEGYIVCDSNFSRVKLKSPAYVAMTHLKEGFSTRRLIEVIQTNESSEFLAYFPEWGGLYETIQAKFEQLAETIQQTYDRYKHIEVQKDFALAIKGLEYSGILFALRAGKIASAAEALRETPPEKLEKMLDVGFIPLGH